MKLQEKVLTLPLCGQYDKAERKLHTIDGFKTWVDFGDVDVDIDDDDLEANEGYVEDAEVCTYVSRDADYDFWVFSDIDRWVRVACPSPLYDFIERVW